jgi:hypothetical protein
MSRDEQPAGSGEGLMPSQSYATWITTRVLALDEIEAAHRAVGGGGRGRRYATQQINQAYAVLLSSQFQGYCRDLHTECVDWMSRGITGPQLRGLVGSALTRERRLDRGNPNPGNIGADFAILGAELWPDVKALSGVNVGRRQLLEELNTWRNAIAHQDFSTLSLSGRSSLRVAKVRQWRAACEGLASAFDVVSGDYLRRLTGVRPW